MLVKETVEDMVKMGEVEMFDTDFDTGEEEEDSIETDELNEEAELSALCVVPDEYTTR